MQRTLTGAIVGTLAGVVNGLPIDTHGGITCPPSAEFDTIVFGSGPDQIVVVAEAGGCDSVSVASGGVEQPALVGGSQVDAAVLSALGLPSSYLR